MKKPKLIISIRSSVIIRILGTTIFILLIASIAGTIFQFKMGHPYVHGFVPKFNLDEENNIPTYFSTFILLISTILLSLIAMFKKREHDLYALHWFILSIIFLCLSIDESASIHELLTKPLRSQLNLSGIFYYSWVIPGITVVLILIIIYLKFFFSLPSRTRYRFLIAAIFYIGGVLGVELLGGYYGGMYDENNVSFRMITTIEESFEMIGISLFINALLKYIAENISNVTFSFKDC